MTSFTSFSQRKDYENYRDGSFIVVFSHTDEKDILCEVMSSNNVDSLIQNNRFIMSIVRTKFGYLVLHRPNVENMPQKFLSVSPTENVEKKLKKEFKLGWSVYYANYQKRFFILNKDMNVVNQEFKKKKYGRKESEKLIKELNAKSFYIRWIYNDKYLIQKINGVVPNQKEVSYNYGDNDFYNGGNFEKDGIIALINKGYKIVDIHKSFNQYSFSKDPLAANWYSAILDEPNDEIPDILPKVVIMDTYEELQSYYNEIVSDNYKITKIFGGWDERNWKEIYDGIEEFNKTHSFNAILGGLISSGTSLNNQINNNSNRSSSQSNNSNSTVESSPTNKSRKWVSCSTCNGTGVCRNCGGSGNYSYTKDGKCHECRPVGSGKCGTCKGKKGSYVQ